MTNGSNILFVFLSCQDRNTRCYFTLSALLTVSTVQRKNSTVQDQVKEQQGQANVHYYN
jgi:hypothetical protein